LNESKPIATIQSDDHLEDFVSVNWQTLVNHSSCVQANDPIGHAYRKFAQIDAGFMAVVEDHRVIGLCARHEIGMKLGSQYGFSLFSKAPVSEHLVRDPLVIIVDQPWSEVLQRVFSRQGDIFNQDAVLVDQAGGLVGLISVQTLVQLQTNLLMQSIEQLKQKQEEITQRNRQLMEDLKMAREMQIAMLPHQPTTLPKGSPPEQSNVCVLSHYAPLGLVSGDFYEVIALSDTAIGVFIADVMGHGVQAALITAMIRALIRDHRSIAYKPGMFLTALNRSLCDILQTSNLTIFASAFILVVDLAEKTLRYANAGHPCPILLRPSTGKAMHLDCEKRSNGGLLGVCSEVTYPSGKMGLFPQDLVLLYTDGLFEIRDANDEILGQERLLALVSERMNRPGEVLIRELVDKVNDFSSEGQFEDDVCLVALEVRAMSHG
jgi:serine phosphatase RsbU (regulator of sigma subunit)